jgi:hypothetical protein
VTYIGNGDGRLVMHLLQTRHPLPDKPEHGSHWESVIMKPITLTVPPPIITASDPILTNGNVHHYK